MGRGGVWGVKVRETRKKNKPLARVWRSVYCRGVIRHVVPLRYGTAFKKAFSDPEVFSAFVRDVVGLELIEDSLDDTIDESAYPHPLMRRVIEAIEVDNLSSRELYLYKEEAEWEDTKTGSFDDGVKKGHKEGLRRGILDVCEVLGIAVQDERQRYLESLDAPALEVLRNRLKQDKRWSDAD